jgi:hypothetical protein
MELARILEEAERQRVIRSSTVRQRNAKVQAIRGAKPKPSSSSFKTTTRSQVWVKTGLEVWKRRSFRIPEDLGVTSGFIIVFRLR